MGAAYGGKIIPFGRKRAFVIYSVMAILSMVLQQYLSTPTLCVGKFLNGIFTTVCHIAGVKMLNETIPVNQLGVYSVLTHIVMSSGYLIVMGLGIILP